MYEKKAGAHSGVVGEVEVSIPTRTLQDNRICSMHIFYTNLFLHQIHIIQENSRKGFGRCRLSFLLHYTHYLSIPLHTNS